jgi:hypothetical protein
VLIRGQDGIEARSWTLNVRISISVHNQIFTFASDKILSCRSLCHCSYDHTIFEGNKLSPMGALASKMDFVLLLRSSDVRKVNTDLYGSS